MRQVFTLLDQYIFMDASFNAAYDVNVLAAAFNMDKAEFMGKLKLIDDFTTFDNERFDVIRANSDFMEEVTAAELALMADVKAVLVDREWFQVYDNLAQFDEKYVASGMYWNYFYHVWKTVSSSPFSNAVVFVDDGATISLPASVQFKIAEVADNGNAKVFTLELNDATAALSPQNVIFVQDETAVEHAIAVHKFGAIIMGTDTTADTYVATYTPKATINGQGHTASAAINVTTAKVGDTVTLAKDA